MNTKTCYPVLLESNEVAEYNTMNEQFCSYEVSSRLKKLGFDEKCFGFYKEGDLSDEHELTYEIGIHNRLHQEFNSGLIAAPLWQQATDWMRLNHKLCVIYDLHTDMACSYDPSEEHFQFKLVRITCNGTRNALDMWNRGKDFNSYLEGMEWTLLDAVESCLKPQKTNNGNR